MNNRDKAILLKDTIQILYEKEGRSFSYIERLLKIDRKTITTLIREWGFEKANLKHLTPSNQKILNKKKNQIISLLRKDEPITKLCKDLGIDRGKFRTFCTVDDDINRERILHGQRAYNKAEERKQNIMNNSSRNYSYEKISDEEWKPILGYPNYQVSNYGRVRNYAQRYGVYYLLKPSKNILSGYMYIKLSNGIKSANLSIARLVGFAFVPGYSEINNTINHKNGDKTCNLANNLEWVSQSENNKHAYYFLNKSVVINNKSPFKKIIYKNKYEFKTVAAFARFICKSETQTRRYLETPSKYEIKIVKK